MPRVLDLFAGCGGISLGFDAAGFEIIGAVEVDPDAALSHALNFHAATSTEVVRHANPLDIGDRPGDVLRRLGRAGAARQQVDIVVGGPPCQAFARVGRAKLREIGGRDDAWLHDERADLYERYVDYIRVLQPVALLLENVPDMLNHGGRNLADMLSGQLERFGYRVEYTLLNAVHFGVPQMRERLFLVALHPLCSSFRWPQPIRRKTLPRGYHGTRTCALRPLRRLETLWDGAAGRFVDAPSPANDLPHAITAKQALGDLPRLEALDMLARGELRRGRRDLDRFHQYCRPARNAFARLMREWPGRESGQSVTAHVIRYLPRDHKLFRELEAGDQFPEAIETAHRLLERELRRLGSAAPSAGTAEFERLVRDFVPPYDPHKFPNKWRKMEPDEPARTLMAHLGKDSYSHIHYDSDQARTISVREAARLQSFPDGFRFAGSMNSAFRQIGNAVPPLLAYALALEIRGALGVPPAAGEDIRERVGLKPPTRAGVDPLSGVSAVG
ncbi:MAG: DNA cytosine methyltransferase [Planctomycetes bacterium]|nr:DNA cytosine methyltransferase [Planctomycetota bacterium]